MHNMLHVDEYYGRKGILMGWLCCGRVLFDKVVKEASYIWKYSNRYLKELRKKVCSMYLRNNIIGQGSVMSESLTRNSVTLAYLRNRKCGQSRMSEGVLGDDIRQGLWARLSSIFRVS